MKLGKLTPSLSNAEEEICEYNGLCNDVGTQEHVGGCEVSNCELTGDSCNDDECKALSAKILERVGKSFLQLQRIHQLR